MKIATARFASTHVDKQGEALALEALHDMVQQINSCYLPMGLEHDPRVPPIGRVSSAQVVRLEDGEWAVDGDVEIFEEGDHIPFGVDARRAAVSFCDAEGIVVIDD